MKGTNILASAAKAASYNMVLQFALRTTTFILNGFILHRVSRELLGVVNVRLTLLYSTTLFLTKEAVDRACLSKGMRKDWNQVINLLWCTFPMAVVCSTILGLIWVYLLEQPTITEYPVGVVLFALSACVEVLAEPLFVIGQCFMFVKMKVIIFGISQGVKCLITMMLVVINPTGGLMNFCAAQVISSVGYAGMYYLYFGHYIYSKEKKDDDFPLKSSKDVLPKSVPGKSFIDWNLASLTWSFFKQSFLKQILTEGERYVMTFFDVIGFGDQGVYDVINNLGSMAARFIFMPIEANIFLFFTHMIPRGHKAEEINQDTLSLCAKALGVVLKLVILIGLIIVVFGYSNAYLALQMYGGTILTDGNGPVLLRWYCLYVLIIAINGTCEAFFFAAMSQQEVDKYNHKMLLFTVFFLVSSWLLTSSIGSVGFILANCLNMMPRIICSGLFITNFFNKTSYKPLQAAVPSLPVLGSLFISFIITAISEVMICSGSSLLHKVAHIAITGVCLIAVLLCVLIAEKDFVNTVKQQMKRNRESSSISISEEKKES